MKVGISNVKKLGEDGLEYKDNITDHLVRVHYKEIDKAIMENMPDKILISMATKAQIEMTRRGL